ncbi:MAG: helix-turn-helix transcriptional regulator [Pseudonocardiales bacterium]|nr:helix-turn-helix transcriptional regulator [Pseudonocardiales bacterium]
MSGDISRADWVVPVQALAPTEPEGIVRLVACRDGSVTVHLSCAGTRGTVRLDVSRAAQLSTGIWEAAGLSQRFIAHLDDDPPAGPGLPALPARSGKSAGSPLSAPPPGPTTPRRAPAGIGSGPAVVNKGVVMDGEQARTVGWRVHRIRTDRGKSLRVIAGLAGMSTSSLHEIEHGQRAVSLTQIRALATALEVAPSELTSLPAPAPANGHTDSATDAIRLALDAVDADHPEGLVIPPAVLREQVIEIQAQFRACKFTEVASDLPGLIRNLHTTLATGTDHAELLELAVYLHVHVTRLWLSRAGAPTDLTRRAMFLARRLAQERNEITTLAVAEFGVADALLAGGALELGRAKLESITLPPMTAATAGLVGYVTACHATAAALEGRYGDMAAPMEAAAEVAERFGASHEVDSLGFVFGPVNVGLFRMWHALEAQEPDQAARIAQALDPERIPRPVNRSAYWVHVGCALAQLRGRHDEAVRALRTAESIFPTMVLRDPNVREALATLLRGNLPVDRIRFRSHSVLQHHRRAVRGGHLIPARECTATPQFRRL